MALCRVTLNTLLSCSTKSGKLEIPYLHFKIQKMENPDKKKGTLIGVIGGLAIVIPLFIWVGVNLNGLSQATKAIYFYNPHESVMTVELNGTPHELQHRERKDIKLAEGSHRLKSSLNGKTLVDTTLSLSSENKNTGGLINLSQEPFYLWKEQYGGMMNMNLASGNLKGLTIDSTVIVGNIKEYPADQIFIPREWFYGIDSEFQDSIRSDGSGTTNFTGESIAKIFDKRGMVEYWEENYGEAAE